MDHARPTETDTLSPPAIAAAPDDERVCHACTGKISAREGTQNAGDTARKLDQYYTCDVIAAYLYQVFCSHFDPSEFQFVEPSAGEGAFLRVLPPGRSIGYDVAPKGSGIIEADFLQTELPRGDKIAVIGNPPFGKNSSLAVKFFNHAARQAEVIAFILPRTFQKTSILKRLNPFFHLMHEEVVQDDAFLFRGERKDVPTVFQIWVRKSQPRVQPLLPTKPSDFEFLKTAHGADFAIQRIGQRAGRIHRNFEANPQSNYFIRANETGVEAVMDSLDLETAARRTAGYPSLARTELVELYAEYMASRHGSTA